MSRGRLIQRFKARIRRLDRSGVRAADPIGTGSGFDDLLREPVLDDPTSDGIGRKFRLELAADIVPCQVGSQLFRNIRMLASGNAPVNAFDLYFHYRDLVSLGLVDANGVAVFKEGDRLDAILNYRTEAVVMTIADPPGLYVIESRPRGFGISLVDPQMNLHHLRFTDRKTATERVEG